MDVLTHRDPGSSSYPCRADHWELIRPLRLQLHYVASLGLSSVIFAQLRHLDYQYVDRRMVLGRLGETRSHYGIEGKRKGTDHRQEDYGYEWAVPVEEGPRVVSCLMWDDVERPPDRAQAFFSPSTRGMILIDFTLLSSAP